MIKSQNELKIAVGIATAGRAKLLTKTLEYISTLEDRPDEIIVCPATTDDIVKENIKRKIASCKVIYSNKGLTTQRNSIIQACKSDILIFFDDDFLPAPDYLSQTKKIFENDSSIILATGKLLADGILTKGIEFEEALGMIKESKTPLDPEVPIEVYSAYGCNMAVRLLPVNFNKVRFDENLPLYGWLEDLDFSRQTSRFGKVVISPCLRGVHLGTKSTGRSPGKQLGYSQIANPLYLIKKGTISYKRAYSLMSKNLLSNATKSIWSESWIDRKGRLSGNICALWDLILGQLHPKNILDM